MPTKFDCPNCGSARTKPVPVAVTEGTRRGGRIGVSRRGVWGSASTYQNDFITSISRNPKRHGCLTTFGALGLVYALGSLIGGTSETVTTSIVIGIISVLVLVGVTQAKRQRSIEQAHWERSWVCFRCGYEWEPSNQG
jgi:hypothetical protein